MDATKPVIILENIYERIHSLNEYSHLFERIMYLKQKSLRSTIPKGLFFLKQWCFVSFCYIQLYHKDCYKINGTEHIKDYKIFYRYTFSIYPSSFIQKINNPFSKKNQVLLSECCTIKIPNTYTCVL